MDNKYNNFYRGLVISNDDILSLGRCKIYVPGVYPGDYFNDADALPYSEPAMPLFGGSGPSGEQSSKSEVEATFAETGFSTVPSIGSYIWVFFENGNHLYPKHFAACQAGPGWLSQHEMQHVMSTPNFKIIIDENPDDDRSSNITDTNNANCTDTSSELQKTDQPVRVKVDIVNTGGIALDLNIIGDVNLKITGDYYTELTGNKHETITGNIYQKIKGNIEIEHEGSVTIDRDGFTYLEQVGDDTVKITGVAKETIVGEKEKTITKSEDIKILQEKIEFVGGNNEMTTGGSNIQNASGIHSHN